MVIDHVGLFFFPEEIVYRLIGRISFPLFAFLIANGAHFTKDIKKYIRRMFIFALISQFPYYLAHGLVDANNNHLNVLFTFTIALFAILLIRMANNKIISIIVAVGASAFAYLLNMDYGAFGVLLTISFYLFFENFPVSALFFVLLALATSFMRGVRGVYVNLSQISFGPPVSTLSLAFIYLYNRKEGPKAKYLFYIFYPLQYFVFYLAKTLL